jgi:hypothetical protein
MLTVFCIILPPCPYTPLAACLLSLLKDSNNNAGVRWCIRLLNCSSLFCFATFPNLSKLEVRLSMLCVTASLLLKVFPSVSSTPSALSATSVCSGASSLLYDCLTPNGSSSTASSFDFPLMCRANYPAKPLDLPSSA